MKISFAIFIAIFNTSRAQICPSGPNITSGPVSGNPKSKSFVRKGTECPCSYAEAECIVTDSNVLFDSIRGEDCSKIEIDGIMAGDNNSYPQVDVEYRWKICNYNEEGTTIRFSDTQNSSFMLKQNTDTIITEVMFNSSTPDLDPGKCETLIEATKLDTKFSKRFMSAQLSSPPYVNGVRATGANCYAYAFNPVEVTYGQCNVETSAKCAEEETDMDCQAFIYSKGDICENYNATLSFSACNKEDRDINISSGRSNVKFWKEGEKKTKFGSLTETLDVGSCQNFTETIEINTCDTSYYGINAKGIDWMQGTYPYLDKDCQSYSFEGLKPNSKAPSQEPSVSSNPAYSNAPSAVPSTSLMPSVSAAPSEEPTEGSRGPSNGIPMQPSVSPAPSMSVMPSTEPSDKASSPEPSVSPAPSVSVMPSTEPSDKASSPEPSVSPAPSVSVMPSTEPSNKASSPEPSVSPAPSVSVMPSTEPSDKASVNPTVSLDPSVSPVPTLSFEPSLSPAPSDSQNPSEVLSAFPSLSHAPSVSFDPSRSPTIEPNKPTVPTNIGPDAITEPPSAIPSVSPAPTSSPPGKGGSKKTKSASTIPSVSPAPTSSPPGKGDKGGSKKTKSASTIPSVSPAPTSSPPGKGDKGGSKKTKSASTSNAPSSPSDIVGAGRAIVSSSSLLCHSITSAISVFLVGTLVIW